MSFVHASAGLALDTKFRLLRQTKLLGQINNRDHLTPEIHDPLDETGRLRDVGNLQHSRDLEHRGNLSAKFLAPEPEDHQLQLLSLGGLFRFFSHGAPP